MEFGYERVAEKNLVPDCDGGGAETGAFLTRTVSSQVRCRPYATPRKLLPHLCLQPLLFSPMG